MCIRVGVCVRAIFVYTFVFLLVILICGLCLFVCACRSRINLIRSHRIFLQKSVLLLYPANPPIRQPTNQPTNRLTNHQAV